WLAMHDSRTPALINVVITAVNVIADVVLYLALPSREKVVGLALGFSLSYFVGALWFGRSLRARLGPANEHRVARTYARLTVAATRDSGSIVVGWLVKVAVVLMLFGIAAFDAVSVGSAHLTTSDDANTAASASASDFQSSHSAASALRAATDAITNPNETMVP